MSSTPELETPPLRGVSADFPLACECFVELTVNGGKPILFLCTPEHLDELAVGYLFTRGILKDPDDIRALEVQEDFKRVSLRTKVPLDLETSGLAGGPSTDRWPGSDLSPDSKDSLPLDDSPPVRLETLQRWARAMFDTAVQYQKTGGMHCAGLAREDGSLCVREDVGRHNAVDKVLGRGFLDRQDFSRCCLLTSGRIAADMMLKALSARVPIVVSRSIPSTAAYEIAAAKGISLVGRIESDEPILYTVPERIVR